MDAGVTTVKNVYGLYKVFTYIMPSNIIVNGGIVIVLQNAFGCTYLSYSFVNGWGDLL